jgi:hypothetical protein
MLEIERRRNAQRRETRGQAPGDAPQIGQFHPRQGGIVRRFLKQQQHALRSRVFFCKAIGDLGSASQSRPIEE